MIRQVLLVKNFIFGEEMVPVLIIFVYGAWGRLRDSATHEAYAPGNEPTLFLGRGYTGHEHLTQFGLINMNFVIKREQQYKLVCIMPSERKMRPANARLYDPALGRFLSPDPYVQVPDFTQSYNRYLYCLNNPLIYTDPDGEFIFTALLPGGSGQTNLNGNNPPTAEQVVNQSISEARANYGQRWHNVQANGGMSAMDWEQGGLDVVGLVPGFGEVADGINALIYVARGDYVNVGLSTAAMIPFAGWAATGVKATRKILQLTSKARTSERALDLGIRVLGEGYQEIPPSVFRSTDGLRQFRMTNADLIPTHSLNGAFTPHVHFEFYSPNNLNVPYVNYHVPLINP